MSETLDRLMEKGLLSGANVRTDSRQVRRGDVFVAVKGAEQDGHGYIKEAFGKGASYVLCQRRVDGLAGDEVERTVVVPDTREAIAKIAKKVFDDPSGSLMVYGVTGTNGKTTTVFLIDGILNNAGRPSGLVSTVFAKTSGKDLVRSTMTTPDAISLNRMLAEMVKNGKKAAVIEMSSHALDQKRTWGIMLESAVFTNITPEHLDYHGDMATYLIDKSKIFNNLKPGGAPVLNADDPMVAGIMETMKFSRVVTFGIKEKDADVRAEGVELSSEGTGFDLVVSGEGSVHIRTVFIGEHNIYNMLAASAALLNDGIGLDGIKLGLEAARPVPGRLDAVASAAPFRVFVDYAHTPNALENVLRCTRFLAKNRLICVFGCGGDRDRTKRPVMGKIAADICDRVILTSDNPRTEDPGSILRQIEKGVLNKSNYSIIPQRREAIREALKAAKDGDIVVIAGKGHEDYQIVGDKVLHFDDKEVAGEILRDMGY